MIFAQFLCLEITKCDARKISGMEPFPSFDQVDQNTQSVERIIIAHKFFHHKQLANNIGQVEKLDEKVQNHQIVSMSLATATPSVPGTILCRTECGAFG